MKERWSRVYTTTTLNNKVVSPPLTNSYHDDTEGGGQYQLPVGRLGVVYGQREGNSTVETGKDLEKETDSFGRPKVDTEGEDVDASFSSDQQNGHLEGWQSRRLRPFWPVYNSLCTPSFVHTDQEVVVCGGKPGHETTICWEIPGKSPTRPRHARKGQSTSVAIWGRGYVRT